MMMVFLRSCCLLIVGKSFKQSLYEYLGDVVKVQEDPILDVLNDLLNYDEILACMVARHNMISVMPDQERFDPQVMQIWDIIKRAMDDVFGVIREYSQAGLGEIEFRLQEYEALFYVFPDTENALVAIIPALANKGLIEVELENARREILKLIEDQEIVS